MKMIIKNNDSQKDKDFVEHLGMSKIVKIDLDQEMKNRSSPTQWRSTYPVRFPTSGTV